VGTRLGNQLTRTVQRINADTNRRDELIVEMYRAGWSYAEIGECGELSKAGVRYILARHGALNGR
jgi:hypothetical protein